MVSLRRDPISLLIFLDKKKTRCNGKRALNLGGE